MLCWCWKNRYRGFTRKRSRSWRQRIAYPLCSRLPEWKAGGLIAYGTSQTEAIAHMAAYVDKILKGAKPSELPVETVTRYELIVNTKTAQEIGVAIPPGVLTRADRVIR